MKQAKGWTLPLLGGALLSLMAVSGCGGNNSNGNSPFIGFVSNGGTSVGGTTGVSGATVAAPFMEVVGQTQLAEFGLNESTGALLPVNFNTTNTNGVGNTFPLSGIGGPITSFFVGLDPTTNTNKTEILVGTATGVQVLEVDLTTGNISSVVDSVTGQPQILSTGGSVQSLAVDSVIDAANNTSVTVVYAALSSSVIEAFTLTNIADTGAGTLTQTQLPLEFNAGANTIQLNGPPVEILPSLGITTPDCLWVLTTGGGTGSIQTFQISNGNDTVPVNPVAGALVPIGVAAAGNGLDIPTSFTLFTSPTNGLVVTSQNNTLSTFTITTTGATGAIGTLLPSGNITGVNVSTPSAVTAVGNAFFVTSTTAGTGNIASFLISENGNNPNSLLITPGNSGANTVNTGVNLPTSDILFTSGLTAFLYDTNGGGGTGSVAGFNINTSTLALTENTTIFNGTNTISQGILAPAINPMNTTIVTSDGSSVLP